MFLFRRRRALRRSLFACRIARFRMPFVVFSSSLFFWEVLPIEGDSSGVMVVVGGTSEASDASSLFFGSSGSASSSVSSSSMSVSISEANLFLLLFF